GGNLLEPSGTLYLKSNATSKNSNKSSIAISAKIRKLKLKEGKLKMQIDKLQEKIEVSQEAESALHKQRLELLGSLATKNAKLNMEKSAEIEAKQSLAKLKSDLEQSKYKFKKIEKDLKEISPGIDGLQKQLKDSDRTLKDALKRIDLLENESEKVASELEKLVLSRNEVSISLVKKKERKFFTVEKMKSIVKDITELRASKSAADEDIIKQVKILDLSKELSVLIDKFRYSISTLSDSLDKKFKLAQTGAKSNQSSLFELQEEKSRADNELDSIKTLINNLNIESSRLEVQIQSAVNIIVQDLHTPVERALEFSQIKNRRKMEDEAFKIDRQISDMGPINTDAYQQYKELKARYEYINKHVEDIKSAAKKLGEIDAIIQERINIAFKECFWSANENFQEIFSILFPGGTARLELVEYKNKDGEERESGIEVIAQPKGKRFKHMTLMSGGEKALIALALLFAVYRIRRAPFYILDEVEAALDDINLSRLIRYFEDIRHSTQLILITHQRRTMEMSDVLLGVSMQSNGITKVVSQRLRQ
ncbi:MAG: hypothetical protein HUJ51_05695, partial [Eggerthellaceae bacterium]|nr:hypothetical protein [Eggerthellaceae bacterium]